VVGACPGLAIRLQGKGSGQFGTMGAASEVEMLQARAQFMRESLGKSRSVTETMISILSSFDNRLSSLETAMRPTQVRFITY